MNGTFGGENWKRRALLGLGRGLMGEAALSGVVSSKRAAAADSIIQAAYLLPSSSLNHPLHNNHPSSIYHLLLIKHIFALLTSVIYKDIQDLYFSLFCFGSILSFLYLYIITALLSSYGQTQHHPSITLYIISIQRNLDQARFRRPRYRLLPLEKEHFGEQPRPH